MIKRALKNNDLRRLQQTNEFNICKNDEASCRTKDDFFRLSQHYFVPGGGAAPTAPP
jgi:hypothetical protein